MHYKWHSFKFLNQGHVIFKHIVLKGFDVVYVFDACKIVSKDETLHNAVDDLVKWVHAHHEAAVS